MARLCDRWLARSGGDASRCRVSVVFFFFFFFRNTIGLVMQTITNSAGYPAFFLPGIRRTNTAKGNIGFACHVMNRTKHNFFLVLRIRNTTNKKILRR